MKPDRFETILIHGGDPEPRIEGAAVMPIFQSSVFEQRGATSYDDLAYPRLNNTPNHRALQRKFAMIEGTEDAVVTGSGMAAISTSLIEAVAPGGHLLAQNTLYGGTFTFLRNDFPDFGLSVDFFDPLASESWKTLLKSNTRAIYAEALTNPLLEVAEHEAIVEFARSHGLISMIDATFAPPGNFRAADVGYDVVIHSGTKYLAGHDDLVCGVVAGPREIVSRIRHRLNHLGGCLDVHGCFLLDRGLKTLALRVRQKNENAQALAEFLAAHKAVARVHYPGLPDSPHHERANRYFKGCGGVLSFDVGDEEDAKRIIERLRIPVKGPSLGGLATLVTRPAASSHLGMKPEERAAMGIGDGLVRVSVGIEAVQDLVDDFGQAMAP